MVDLKVRTKHLRVKVELLQFQLMGVVCAVPRHKLKVIAFGLLGKGFHLVAFLNCGRLICNDKVVE